MTEASALHRRTLVLASDNAGKRREFAALLAPLNVRIVAQGSLGVTGADEPFATFVENALAKARHAAAATRLPAFADDSGLACDALDGAPGVRSARWAGTGATDAANNAALLAALRGQRERAAHYVCVIVAVRHADDPEPLIAKGRWAGQVVDTPRGDHGFGYDPLFLLPDLGLTAAQLAPERKNRISHRALAARRLIAMMQSAWGWNSLPRTPTALDDSV